MTDCEILRIRGVDLQDVCEKHPEVGQVILDRLAAVIAERKQCQSQVMSILSNGIRSRDNQGEGHYDG